MEKPKVIYLKALFKKHKAENKLEKIIKDFVGYYQHVYYYSYLF